MRPLPPMNALAAFEATARLGSVTAAAQELGRSHGAVSKQIKSLSEAAGVPLFEKHGTGLQLTPYGATFLKPVTGALDTLAEAFAEAQNAAVPQLVLGLSATLASRWMMPRLSRFREQYPGVDLDLRMSGRHPMASRDCDLILSWDRLRFPGSQHEGFEPLGDVAFGLVCAAGYPLGRDGDRIHVPTRLVPDTNPNIWDIWASVTGDTVTGDTDFMVPQAGLLIEAALNGMGVALLEQRLIEAELQDGRLIAPYGFHAMAAGFGAFVSRRGWSNPMTPPFLDWLKREATGSVQRVHASEGRAAGTPSPGSRPSGIGPSGLGAAE